MQNKTNTFDKTKPHKQQNKTNKKTFNQTEEQFYIEKQYRFILLLE